MKARGKWMRLTAAILWLGNTWPAGSAENPRLGFPLPPPQEIGRIDALPSPAVTLLLSPDGKTLYAGDTGGLITVWDMATRANLRELRGHSGRVNALALSPSGELLVSGGSDRSAIIWDLKTGLPKPAVKLEKEVLSVAFSPDSAVILAAGRDAAIRVISASSGEVMSEFREPDAASGYRTVTFLDQEHGIAGRFPGRIVVWNLKAGKLAVSFSGQAEGTLKVDATGHWLFATPDDFSLSFWPIEEIRKAITSGDTAAIQDHPARRFYHKLQRLAYTSIPFDRWNFAPSGTARVWEPTRGFVWPMAPAEPLEIVGADLAADGSRAVISHWDRTIRIWDVAKLMPATGWRTGSEYVTALTASADGQLLLSTDPNHEINVWNPTTGETRLTASRSSRSRDLARPGVLLADGDKLLTLASGDRAALDVVDLRTMDVVKSLSAPSGLSTIRSNRQGQLLLAGFAFPGTRAPVEQLFNRLVNPSASERISALQIYDRAGNQIGGGFPGHLQNGVRAAVFSPNAAFVASLDETGTTRVFETKSQRQISSAKISVPERSDLVVTDDGMLVTASALGSLHCFRAVSGEAINAVDQAHWKPIRKLALSPNGKLVATMAEDHLIKLWSLPGFEPRGGFDAPKADQYTGSVLFLNDQTLAAGGVGGIVRIWKIKDAIDLGHWNVHSSGAGADAVAISDDGARIALGDATGVLHLLDAENSRELAALPAHSGGVRQVQFVTGSHEVITKGAEGPPLRWDWERTSKSATAEGEKLPSGRHDTLSALDAGVQIAGSEGIFFDRGRASEKFLSIYGIQSSRVLAGEHWLMVAAPSGIWIVDTEKRALIWGFEPPAYTYGLALDTRRRELISTHDDGVVRRWKIPDKSQTLPRKEHNGN
jgi:WD40 repeat protein